MEMPSIPARQDVSAKKVSVRQSIKIPIRSGQLEADFITFKGLDDGLEHFALGLGAWKDKEEPLVRIHSECLTGDVFFSAKCDCGQQLQEALDRCTAEGGLVLYLRQEGRGIGLYNKIDAYHLQSLGFDTFEANHFLNFPDDLRDFKVAAEMLEALNIRRIKLLSNNPDKQQQLERHGIAVAGSFHTGTFVSQHNRSYLQAKVSKAKHKLNLL